MVYSNQINEPAKTARQRRYQKRTERQQLNPPERPVKPARKNPLPIRVHNSQQFPRSSLLGLPAEIRNFIWRFTFDGAKCSEDLYGLLSCRQIYHEAHMQAFQFSRFRIDGERWRRMPTSRHRTSLRRALTLEKRRLITSVFVSDRHMLLSCATTLISLHRLGFELRDFFFDAKAFDYDLQNGLQITYLHNIANALNVKHIFILVDTNRRAAKMLEDSCKYSWCRVKDCSQNGKRKFSICNDDQGKGLVECHIKLRQT